MSVSNSLFELGTRFPELLRGRGGETLDQRELILLLAFNRYMNTSLDGGTGASELLCGIHAYLRQP